MNFLRQISLVTCCFVNALSCHAQDPVKTNSYYSIGITGSAEDVQATTQGGLLLMGGSTDVDEAMRWMLGRSGKGDVVIIRASGSTGYNEYLFELSTVNSVETLLIDSRAKAMEKSVGQRIREAEALFIAGGDQANYVNYWSDSEVSRAIHYLLHEKRVPIGGTSAGCAVLSEFVFDARKGSVTSIEALSNPYDTLVSISKSFIDAPFLKGIIADQHYSQRGREGRHVTFLARLQKDGSIRQPKGIGVDEKTAVCIDELGNAKVFGSNSAYFLQTTTTPDVCASGKPLSWNGGSQTIRVTVIKGSGTGTDAFNLREWPAKGGTYWYVENGELKK